MKKPFYMTFYHKLFNFSLGFLCVYGHFSLEVRCPLTQIARRQDCSDDVDAVGLRPVLYLHIPWCNQDMCRYNTDPTYSSRILSVHRHSKQSFCLDSGRIEDIGARSAHLEGCYVVSLLYKL